MNEPCAAPVVACAYCKKHLRVTGHGDLWHDGKNFFCDEQCEIAKKSTLAVRQEADYRAVEEFLDRDLMLNSIKR